MNINVRPDRALALLALIWGGSILLCLFTPSCASVTPGADPFVVRVEQTQTAASATFDFVLNVDNADRGFWRTNAAAFHTFCEWLRTPTLYGSQTAPRAVVMELNVDDLKLAYKTASTSGNSNALWTAWAVLGTAMGQASSWQNIVTNTVH